MDDVAAQRWLAARSVVIVPGAMKAGTCSLRSQLQWLGHGQDFFLPNQELHYFDEDEEFEKGAAYYSSWFCDAAWADWGPKTIGDVTPSYMYLPKAMPRIAELLPHARIVVLLRNPINRAVSHHNHDLSKGRDVGTLQERWQQLGGAFL